VKSAEQRCFGVGETVTSVFQRCFGIREMNSAAPQSFSIMKNHQCCKTVFQHRESFVLFEESVFPVLLSCKYQLVGRYFFDRDY
jgi:hypothetical protein